MNITDSIIIVVSLISLTVVIVIVTKSLKRVDKDIIKEIENNNKLNKKEKITTKLNRIRFIVLEWLVRKTKQGIQKIHSWTLKAKKKSNSEFFKAKDELSINNNKQHNDKKVKREGKNKNNKQKTQDNKTSQEGGILEKISLQDEDIIMDSIVKNNKDNKNSFIKTLFKRKKNKKTNVDIRKKEKRVPSEWSLSDNPTNDKEGEMLKGQNALNKTEDTMIGVDREILEKKILQKIDKNPKDINNYRELGELYIKMKKYDDAMEVFKYILSVLPDDFEAKRRQDKIKLLQGE